MEKIKPKRIKYAGLSRSPVGIPEYNVLMIALEDVPNEAGVRVCVSIRDGATDVLKLPIVKAMIHSAIDAAIDQSVKVEEEAHGKKTD